MVVGNLTPVTPYTDWSTCCITITFQLLFSIFQLWFLDLYNNVWTCRLLFVKNDNISTFLFPTKRDFILQFHSRNWITQITGKNQQIQLAHHFFRSYFNILSAYSACKIILCSFFCFPFSYTAFQLSNLRLCKQAKVVFSSFDYICQFHNCPLLNFI